MSLVHERGFPAHSPCVQHQRRWKAKDHVRPHLHKGYRSTVRQHRVQKADVDMNNRNHRGLRHYWGLPFRGQHTETIGSGRREKIVGVSKKR